MNIAIVECEYIFANNFDEQSFEHRDARLMDKCTKIIVTMAKKLYTKVKGHEIIPEDIGIVLSSERETFESISENNSVLKTREYTEINPSKFPNTMPAVLLSKAVMEIGAKGPCLPLLPYKTSSHAFKYAIEQIKTGRCRAMLIICISNTNDCLGFFIEDELSCERRGMEFRHII